MAQATIELAARRRDCASALEAADHRRRREPDRTRPAEPGVQPAVVTSTHPTSYGKKLTPASNSSAVAACQRPVVGRGEGHDCDTEPRGARGDVHHRAVRRVDHAQLTLGLAERVLALPQQTLEAPASSR